MRITSILIGGVEFVSYALKESTDIAVASNGVTSTAQFVLSVKGADVLGVSIKPQMAVTIHGGETADVTPFDELLFDEALFGGPPPVPAVLIFSGYVSRVEPKISSWPVVLFSVSCQDDSRKLDRTVVASKTYINTSDKDVLDDLFATYLPSVTTIGVRSASPPVVLTSISFLNLTMRQCVERICDRTGAQWRLGFDSDLKYYDIGTDAGAFGFSDAADGSATEFYLQSDFGYEEQFSTPVNVCNVIGSQPVRPDAVTTTFSESTTWDDIEMNCWNTTGWPPLATDNPHGLITDTSITLRMEAPSDTGDYAGSNGYLRFNTASIPDDAEILSAELLIQLDVTNCYGMSLGIDYYASSNWPILIADWTVPDVITARTPTAYGWQEVRVIWANWFYGLVTLALKNLTTISKTDYTGFRLYLGSEVIPWPPGNNQARFYTFDSIAESRRPTLRITYRSPQPALIAGSYTDAASVALYGSLEKTITDANCTTAGEADERAEIETVRFGLPRKSINCTFDRDGLDAGETVHFTSALLGLDGDFTIQKLRMRWPAGQSHTRYYAELGEARPDLITYLRNRQ